MIEAQYFRLFFLVVLSINSIVIGGSQTDKKVFISKCLDYLDKRDHSISRDQNTISIPFSRTSQQAYSSAQVVEEQFSFNINIRNENSKSNLRCNLKDSEIRNIEWNISDNKLGELEPRNFHDVTTGSAERHQHSYFTESGYFYDANTGNYYNSKSDYCLESISDDDISLRICAANSNCSNPTSPNTYCLPKCCALDETLLFWKRQCVRLPETVGMPPWQPPIYQGVKNPHKTVNLQTSLIHHMTELPKNCLGISKDGTFEELGYGSLSAVDVKHPKFSNKSEEKQHFKLSLPSGNGGMLDIMIFDDISRKWIVDKIDNFCVEGFHVNSIDTPTYTGNPNNFVLLYCINEDSGYTVNEEGNELKSWMYVVVSLIALLFLLTTIVVYAVLWDKHNLHGLTIASYIGSMFGAYAFFTIAHMIYLYPNEEITGVHDRGPFCYTVATLAHYFYLSSYFWLTVMNLDLWMTLSSMRAVRRNSKEWFKFGIYSGIGWGLPMLLIIAFVVIDNVYRDPLTEVPVPDYAAGSCFVSIEFRGQYVFIPMAILLAVNILLIAMTMAIFLKAKCRNSKSTNIGNATNTYISKLFAKLFIVMGGTSLVDFLTWIYNNKDMKPWIIVILEALSYLVPVMLFFLFCLNEKVIGQLTEKYPRFTGKVQPVLQIFVRENSRKRYTFDDTAASCNKTRELSINGMDKNQVNIELQSLAQE